MPDRTMIVACPIAYVSQASDMSGGGMGGGRGMPGGRGMGGRGRGRGRGMRR